MSDPLTEQIVENTITDFYNKKDNDEPHYTKITEIKNLFFF